MFVDGCDGVTDLISLFQPTIVGYNNALIIFPECRTVLSLLSTIRGYNNKYNW